MGIKQQPFIFLSLVLIGLLLSGCSSKGSENSVEETPENTYSEVSVEQFESMMQDKDFILINVRTPFDGNIPGTDLNIPYDEIDRHLDELPQDKNAKILLYCKSSRTSTIAANTLLRLGYTNVWQLKGGYDAWKAAGNVLEQ